MALRPFGRNPKSGEEAEPTPDEESEVDQFFSAERRRRGNRPADDTHPSETGQSGDAGPRDDAAVAGQVPAIADYGVAGWYPDADDPGLMRYWDGFHLTGQVLHVHARASDAEEGGGPTQADGSGAAGNRRADDGAQARDSELASSIESLPALNQEDGVFLPPSLTLVEPRAGGSPAVPDSLLESEEDAVPGGSVDDEEIESDGSIDGELDDESADESVDEPADEWVELEDESADHPVDEAVDESADLPADEPVDEAKDGLEDEELNADPPAVAGSGDTDGHGEPEQDRNSPPQLGARPFSPVSPGGGSVAGDAKGEANRWAKEAEKAVARATTAGSPETWREAARLAVVVAEMTQTLQAAAEADQAAAQLAEAAREAARRARAAEQKSTAATQAVQQAQRAAQEADDAARKARQTAVEAQAEAERASQAVPEFLEAEKVAVKAAADAQRKAQSLGEIVGTASQSDTAPAWSEALRLASAQVA